MNKTLKNCITAVICLLVVIIISSIVLLSYNNKQESPPDTTAAAEYLYTLTEYNGKIALYKKGFSMPVEIFDVNISSLPEIDRELIQNGIHAANDNEIQKIIEDYTS